MHYASINETQINLLKNNELILKKKQFYYYNTLKKKQKKKTMKIMKVLLHSQSYFCTLAFLNQVTRVSQEK